MIDGNPAGLMWTPVVEVRSVGHKLYEARTEGGMHAATGFTQDGAIEKLRARLPQDTTLVVRIIGERYMPEEFDSDPENELEGDC